MTLRLSLVIDGDASGAERALSEAGAGVEDLGRRADGATGKLEGATGAIERAGPGLRVVGQEAGTAADALDRTGDAASGVVDGLGRASGAADALSGAVRGVVGAAAGFAAGLGIAAVTAALSNATAAAVEFARQMLDASYRIEQALSAQAGLVRDVAAGFREAAGAASSYGLVSAPVTRLGLEANRAALQAEFDAEARRLGDPGLVDKLTGGGLLKPDPSTPANGVFGPDVFAGVKEAYVAGLAAGTPDIIAARDEIARIGAAQPLDSVRRMQATNVVKLLQRGAENQAGLARVNDALAALDGDLEALKRATGFAPPAPPGVRPPPPPRRLAGGDGRAAPLATGTASGFAPGSAPAPTPRPELLGAGAEELRDALEEVRGATLEFSRALIAGQSPLEALGKAALRLSDRLLESALDKVAGVAFGGLGSVLGGALGVAFGGAAAGGGGAAALPVPVPSGLFHSGGIVGAGGASRMAPAALFAAAPRLHSGGILRPGERPAILLEGEEVGWPEQLKRKYGGGGQTVNYWNVQTPNPRAFVESQATAARAASAFVARAGRHA